MRDLSRLSDEALLSQIGSLLGSQRRLLARLLRYLQEVEERRLHLRLAHSSMFDFCTRRLAMSEGEAHRRIAVARLARRYPEIIDLVEAGAVYITTVMLLRDHLTDDNHEELLGAIRGKHKAEVEVYVAGRFPKPDVPSVIRKLPSGRSPATPELELPMASSPAESAHAPQAAVAAPAEPAAQPAAAPQTPAVAPQTTSAPPPPGTQPQRPRLEQLSATRWKIQFTTDDRFKEKMERARRLLSHENPKMDLAVVMERALDALLADLDKKKLARTERPRRARPPKAKGTISRQTRREVFLRDGEQCTFVGEDGRRCEEKAFLTLDHVEPEALGGTGEGGNIRPLCQPHNLFEAERVFGKEYVARRIRERRERQRAAQAAARAGEARRSPAPNLAKNPGKPGPGHFSSNQPGQRADKG